MGETPNDQPADACEAGRNRDTGHDGRTHIVKQPDPEAQKAKFY